MKVELIKKNVFSDGMLYMGLPYFPILFGAYFKGCIGKGKTASEAINNCFSLFYRQCYTCDQCHKKVGLIMCNAIKKLWMCTKCFYEDK